VSLVVVEPGTSLGEVLSIHVAPARKVPTKRVESVVAEAGVGLVGDRYHGSRHRHVTIQSAPDLAAAGEALGSPVEAGATRRNLTVSGGPLPGKPGTRVRVGEDVLLEVVRPAAPCRLLDDWIGEGAMKSMHARGGSVFRILSGGTIAVGDRVVVERAPEPTELIQPPAAGQPRAEGP
jgi:MOSC domain-containing protein YiiM